MQTNNVFIDLEKLVDTVQIYIATYSIKILAALVIFFIGRWIARKLAGLFARLMEKNHVDLTIVKFLQGIVYYSLLTLVLISAVGQLGIPTASFLTIVGAAGLAVGLALKDALSNFASGVMLVLFRPFKVGDFVSAGGVDGTVQGIDVFNTILHTPDNKRVIIPNSGVTKGIITNVTANPTRRLDILVGISYEDDIARAKALLEDIIKSDSRILKTPPPVVAVSELADSSVNIVVRPWVNTPDYGKVSFALNESIKTTFDREGIRIPFPQRDVHLYKRES